MTGEKTRHAPSAEIAAFAYKFCSGPTDIENVGKNAVLNGIVAGTSVGETLSNQCRRVCHEPNVLRPHRLRYKWFGRYAMNNVFQILCRTWLLNDFSR